jgi:sialate O-acetylesterase
MIKPALLLPCRPGLALAMFAMASCGWASVADAAPVLAPIWGDHAVIQRGRPILVEGAPIRARRSWPSWAMRGPRRRPMRKAFTLTFAPRAAGDPLTLTVTGKGGARVQVNDLLVGEVYLCSGQSNMELTVDRALDSWNQIHSAHDPDLRMVTIPKGVSDHPETAFAGPVAWQPTNIGTVGAFSAACYYMARDLRGQLHVPVGAIHASWGGSASRPWLTPEAARAIYGEAEIALLKRYQADPVGAMAQFAPRWQEWYRATNKDAQPWANPDSVPWAPCPRWAHGTIGRARRWRPIRWPRHGCAARWT